MAPDARPVLQAEQRGTGHAVATALEALPVLPDDATVAAIRKAASLEAMLTDPVYEGKSMAGLIAMAENGEIPKGSKVLYVHLGGAPALNAYHNAFG